MKKTLLTVFVALSLTNFYAQIFNGLVAKYTFNGGNANDEIGTNNGTVNNAVLTTDRFGNANMAYNFNGSNATIDLGASTTLKNSTATISFWVKPENSSSWIAPMLFIRSNVAPMSSAISGVQIMWFPSPFPSKPNVFMDPASLQSSVSFESSDWTHIAVSYDDDSLSIYLNGQKGGTIAKGFISDFSATAAVLLGGLIDGTTSHYFKGDIDDVLFYNRVLSSQEIATLHYESSSSCLVSIPDANFKNALLNHNPVIDINGDSEIQCYEAYIFDGTIDVNGQNISDLSGIEAFKNIIELNVNNNNLSDFDLSSNTFLSILNCDSNQFTILNISTYDSVTKLSCKDNQLAELNVANGNNTNFTGIDATENADLVCIIVDNASFSNTNWTSQNEFYKSESSNWVENCNIGFADFENQNAITIYPNPTSGFVNLSSTSDIQVFDMSGRQLISKTNVNSIDLSNQTTGVYFIKISNESNINVLRIIKQ